MSTRQQINEMGAAISSFADAFGKRGLVNRINHSLASAYGWGDNPERGAMYFYVTPTRMMGTQPTTLPCPPMSPVEAFWSVTVYIKDGFFEPNDANAYSFNSITAKKNEHETVTIAFGGDPTQSNHLPITDGWNYIVRCCLPGTEIRNGGWIPPSPIPAK